MQAQRAQSGRSKSDSGSHAKLTFLAEGLEQLLGPGGHEFGFGARLEEEEAFLLILSNLLQRSRRPAKNLPISLAGGDNLGDGFLQPRMVLMAAQAQRERKVARANEDHINA